MADAAKNPLWKQIAHEQRLRADNTTTKLREARLARDAALPPVVAAPAKKRAAKAKA